MKNFLLAISLVFITTTLFSQTVSYGIKGGINLAGQTRGNDITAFHAGGIVNVEYKNFSLQPALLYTVKGSSVDVDAYTSGDGPSSWTETTRLNYIQVPVNILYRIQPSKHANMFFGGGPYIAHAISGSVKGGGSVGDPFAGNHPYKRFDYGAGLVVGIELNKSLLIGMNADFGMANIWPLISTKNNVLGFSVGYLFK